MKTRRRHRGASASLASGPVYFFLVARFAFLVARLAAFLTRRVVFRAVARAAFLALRTVFFACLLAFLAVFLATFLAALPFLATVRLVALRLATAFFFRALPFLAAVFRAFLAAFFTFLPVFFKAFSTFLATFSISLPAFFTAFSADRLTGLVVGFFLAAGFRGAAFLGASEIGAGLALGAAGSGAAGVGSLASGIGSIHPEPDQPVSVSFCSAIVYILHHSVRRRYPPQVLGQSRKSIWCGKAPITCNQTQPVQGVRHWSRAWILGCTRLHAGKAFPNRILTDSVPNGEPENYFATCPCGAKN